MMCVICCDPESDFTVLCSGHSTEVRRSMNVLLASTLCSSRSRGGPKKKSSYRLFPSKYNICSSRRNFCEAFINCSVQFIINLDQQVTKIWLGANPKIDSKTTEKSCCMQVLVPACQMVIIGDWPFFPETSPKSHLVLVYVY